MARIHIRGRQRLEIRRIPDPIKRRAAFSKRRSGLYKKANELSILCGVDVALIIFSPAGKVFSFGCPNLNSVMDRFLTQPPYQMNQIQNIIEAHCNPNVHILNGSLNIIKEQFSVKKECGEELKQMLKTSQEKNWWAGPIDQMTKPKLQLFKGAVEELKRKLIMETERRVIQSSNTESHPQIFSGSCSSHPPHFYSNGSGSSDPPQLFASEHSSSNLPQFFIGCSSSNCSPQVQVQHPPAQVFQPPMLQNPMVQNPVLQNSEFDENEIIMVPTPRVHNNMGAGHGPWFF